MAHPSSTTFDDALRSIDHFHRYPAMLPFVGPDFVAGDHRRLLVLGESNYFPESSTIHHNAKMWYAGDQSATNSEEAEWIHCRGLLECGWDSGGHQIYRNLNQALSEVVSTYTDRPMSTIAYMNTFQRPAQMHDSIKNVLVDQDCIVATTVVNQVIKALAPNVVIFTSKFAWDAVGWRIAPDHPSIHCDFTCHPASRFRHWHRKDYPHGKAKFLKLLRERFVAHPIGSHGE